MKEKNEEGESVTKDVHYTNYEKYYQQMHLLYVGDTPAGSHTYSFFFQLPNDLPWSYEAEYGSVR